jgi:spermidine/putrescine-binding protein/formylglycine-generating enzyme required for sulfatase activity
VDQDAPTSDSCADAALATPEPVSPTAETEPLLQVGSEEYARAETLPLDPGQTTPPPTREAVSPDGETVVLAPGAGSGSGKTFWELAPGDIFGPLEILGELGRGGMGVVFRAREVELGREVALKVLSTELSQRPRELARFRREAALASKLRHPRIVGVYTYGEVEGRTYYTMPIVEGESLKDVLTKGHLAPARAAELVEMVARAIDSAHQQRVVHRDLKPANVVLDPAGAPLVLDFGLAKDLLSGPELTRTGEILGTPCYMSPEQAAGETDRIDHRVDVYALGTILYECLTGQVAYGGQTATEVIAKILTEDPPAPRSIRPEIPYELETIVLHAMRRERFLRYQTAGALADDLGRYRRREPVIAKRPGLGAKALRWVRAHKSTTVLAALLVATLLGVVVFAKGYAARVATAQRVTRARELLKSAQEAEARGDGEGAARGYLEATVIAEGAFGEAPDDVAARATLLDVLAARATSAEEDGDWELAEELFGRRYRLTESDRDYEAWRHARGLARVDVSGLATGDTLTFVRWDRGVGQVDSSRPVQASLRQPQIELRAGSYLAGFRPANTERVVPFLVVIGRGEDRAVEVFDPGVAPEGMVFVPGSSLVLGSPGKAGRVARTQPLWMDAGAVTVADYRRFLASLDPSEAKERRPPNFPRLLAQGEEGERTPVAHVCYADAKAYAAWAKKRLPLREEWLAAAGGSDGRAYPWGDRFQIGRANLRRDELAPEDAYSQDVSPYGVLGLAGNGDEWVADAGPDVGTRLLCGVAGAYQPQEGGRIERTTFALETQRFGDTTFRCARTIRPPRRVKPLPLGVPAPPTPRATGQGALSPIVLRVAAWPRYADPAFTGAFARRYLQSSGVAVLVTQVMTVASNDEYRALLQDPAHPVDLVVPSCDMAPQLIRERLVQPFDVPNSAELLPAFRHPPFLQRGGRSFGACYASGPMWLITSGDRPVLRRWGALWDPQLRGKIAVWDDAVWAVTLAALDLGLSPVFDLSDAELKRVGEHLTALLRNGCRLWRDHRQVLDWLRKGEVVASDDWGILGWELERTGYAVQRVVPKGGSAQWIDSWMIASHLEGPRLEAARAWVEYAVSPENQRDLLLQAGYDPTNARAVELLDKASALSRVRTVRERQLVGLQRWRPVPRREEYLATWAAAKRAVR